MILNPTRAPFVLGSIALRTPVIDNFFISPRGAWYSLSSKKRRWSSQIRLAGTTVGGGRWALPANNKLQQELSKNNKLATKTLISGVVWHNTGFFLAALWADNKLTIQSTGWSWAGLDLSKNSNDPISV